MSQFNEFPAVSVQEHLKIEVEEQGKQTKVVVNSRVSPTPKDNKCNPKR